jgi:pimeloyl-ACP methyl ester carboxylesterase
MEKVTVDGTNRLRFSTSARDFVQFSCSCPMEVFTDVMNNITWEYRQGRRDDAAEAVVLIPSIYETTNCLYRLGTELLSAGYRILIVNIPACQSILGAQIGFDLLLATKQIFRVHLVGFGFGGFLTLHLVHFHNLCTDVLSLSLIAAFMDTNLFQKPGGFLARFTGKYDLTSELSIEKVPPALRESVEFVKSELDTIPGGAVALRLRMRGGAGAIDRPRGSPRHTAGRLWVFVPGHVEAPQPHNPFSTVYMDNAKWHTVV